MQIVDRLEELAVRIRVLVLELLHVRAVAKHTEPDRERRVLPERLGAICVCKPPASAKAKGKGTASAATSDTSSTIADQDLKRAKAHIGNLNRQIRELGKPRDAQHLKYAKARPSAPISSSTSRPKR